MLTYCLLAAFAFGAVIADDPAKVLCNKVEAQKNVDFTTLKGNWIAYNSVAFSAGQPINPPNPSEDKRTKTCLYSKVDCSTCGTGATIKTDAHYPGKDTLVETSTLTALGSEQGAFSIHSDIQDRTNWEFKIIDSNPSKYLVYLLCQPPNEAGERLPERVNLMSRHGDHEDHALLTPEDITQIQTSMATKLGIAGRGIVPVKYSNSCWSSYAEA